MNSFNFRRFISPAVFIAFICALMVSCGKTGEESYSVEFIPVQTSEEGAWIFVDNKGERIGTQEWEFEPTVTANNIFTARTDSGLTVYYWDKDVAKPVDSLQNLVAVGIYNEGLLPVTPPMERIRIVNKKGELQFTLDPIDGQEISACADKFSEGLIVVRNTQGMAGVVNNKGEVVVKPQFSEISNFSDGHALAVNYNYDNYEDGPSYFVIDKEGKITPVKADFKFSVHEECVAVPEFQDSVVQLDGMYEEAGNYRYFPVQVNVDGQTKELKNTQVNLPDGGKFVIEHADSVKEYWEGADGKTLLTIDEPYQRLKTCGDFVCKETNSSLEVYNLEGVKLNTFQPNDMLIYGGENFGVILEKNVNEYLNGPKFYLLNDSAQLISDKGFYGVGIRKTIRIKESEFDGDCGFNVTSAYVDVTAAASKLVAMITHGIPGEGFDYFLGESVKSILQGGNSEWSFINDRTFTIPTDSTGYLATGPGFTIKGIGEANTFIMEPTYEEHFEIDYYDYWGRAWGRSIMKQTGEHINPNARVCSFDLHLFTNHSSGQKIREAIGRRLKKEGYTLVKETPNYDEYSELDKVFIIYGNAETPGVGVVCGSKDDYFFMSDDDKEALVSKIRN